MRKQKKHPRVRLTRQKILAESVRIFNRRGYRGATLDHIARALGVTKAALYYHVRSKQELLFQCHWLALDIGKEAIRQALARASTPDEQLRIVVAYYIEGLTDQLRGGVVLLEQGALSPRHHRQIIARRDENERMLRKIIEEGVATGVFVPCDPKLVGLAILGAVNWIPKWYDPEGQCSAQEIAGTLSTYFVRGLQKRPLIDRVLPVPEEQTGCEGRDVAMKERKQMSRREILSLGGMAVVGGAVTALSNHDAEAGSTQPQADGRASRDFSRPPCIGEPGYAERMARLFADQERNT